MWLSEYFVLLEKDVFADTETPPYEAEAEAST
jgi:hypothetical protein